MKRSFLDQNSNVFFTTQPSQTTPRSQIAQDAPSLSLCLEHKDRKGEERARVCKRSVEASFHSRIERENKMAGVVQGVSVVTRNNSRY